jgi:MtrB/PioB family decaheme-associated outer membrane protein
MYKLRFGKYGLLDVQAEWFEIPHNFSTDLATTPYQESGGNFTLMSKPAPPPPAGGKNIKSWVEGTSHTFDLSLLEGIANLYVRYTPTPELTFNANMNYQNPTGEQWRGGSFLFGPSPGTYNVSELWVPTQYYTYNFGTGVDWAKNGWFLGFQYQGSVFVDKWDTITWDNPDTWHNAVGANGQCIDNAVYSPVAGTGPCRGRAAMYPDNQAHNFIVNAGASLPFNTHLMASVEYGFWLQDQPFIPMTSNSALSQPLPRDSLDGDVRPFFGTFTLESNPIEALELRASYSYYDFDNHTPKITFAGVKSLNDVASAYTATAFPYAFSVQNINLDPTYKITETLAAHLMGRISTYHNRGLMVLQQDETAYGPALDWTPRNWLTFRADYQHAHRSSPGYNNDRTSLAEQNAGEGDLANLRRFDQATVDVNQTELYSQVQVTKEVGLFAAFDYDDYNFPGSDFGLQHSSSYSPSLGVSWEPAEGIHLFSDYSWQAYDWNLRSIQRTNPAQNEFNKPKQVWTSLGRTQSNAIDLGAEVAIPKNYSFGGRPSNFKLQYTYVVGNNTIHDRGDTGLQGPGGAVIFPDSGTQFHELIFQYKYMLRDNVALGFGYYFSHFGEMDFGMDNMQQWMGKSPNSIFMGNTPFNPYNANVGFVTVDYKF